MKFKGFVIGLLAAILIVNTIGVVLMIREEREQTKIALAEYDAISTTATHYLETWIKENPDIDDMGLTADKIWNIFEIRTELGLD